MQCNTKFIIALFSIICSIKVVKLAIDESLEEDVFAIYLGSAITVREIINGSVTEDQITFYLYTSENSSQYTKLDTANLEVFRNTTNSIVFLIHGWSDSWRSQWLEDMKNAFLVKDPNSFVIKIDWEIPSSQRYYVAAVNTYDVSTYVTKFLVNLNQNYGVDKDNFLVVGHSMGSQVAGFVGKMFKNETALSLPRIIGLDPAGPLFIGRPTSERLYKTDADVVEVVHSDGGTFGYLDPCGTIDFFPNGGSTQPGCPQVELLLTGSLLDIIGQVACAHGRAIDFFREGILNTTSFISKRCSSYLLYETGFCNGVTVALGDLTTTLTGNFYLDTNAASPYSK